MKYLQWGSLANTIIRLPLAVIPIFIIERVGRRPMLIISEFVTILALSMIMVSIVIGEAAKVTFLIYANISYNIIYLLRFSELCLLLN